MTAIEQWGYGSGMSLGGVRTMNLMRDELVTIIVTGAEASISRNPPGSAGRPSKR